MSDTIERVHLFRGAMGGRFWFVGLLLHGCTAAAPPGQAAPGDSSVARGALVASGVADPVSAFSGDERFDTVRGDGDGDGDGDDGVGVGGEERDVVPGRALVRGRAGQDEALAQLFAENDIGVLHTYSSPERLFLVALPDDLDVKDALALLSVHGAVEYAEPDVLIEPHGVPSDPMVGSQWSLENFGQHGGTRDADLNAFTAWDIETGSDDVVIAVIDTGIDVLHEDLIENLWVNPGEIAHNGVDDDGNGFVDDVHGADMVFGTGALTDDSGHGTAVAGIIGARGDNGIGVAGVAWNVKLLGCRALQYQSPSFHAGLGGALRCLEYIHKLKTRAVHPVDIVATNNSWGSTSSSAHGYSRALRDAIDAQREAGILWIASTGNMNMDTDRKPWSNSLYAMLPNTVIVGASDGNDARAPDSNHGRHSVHLSAPGTSVFTTLHYDQYFHASGTSMAAPHVTGVVALLKAQDPTRDWAELKNLALAGAQPVSALSSASILGARVRAADTGGTGSLTCADRTVARRLRPDRSLVLVPSGSLVELDALHFTCAHAAGPLTVPAGNGAVVLTDDGMDADAAAADGQVSWAGTAPEQPGSVALTYPDGDVAVLHAIHPYRPGVEVPYVYRELTSSALFLGHSAVVGLPFPVRFGDHPGGFIQLAIGREGVMSFTDVVGGVGQRLPSPFEGQQAILATFWDSLPNNPFLGEGVYVDVLGSAPTRELVVEWRNLRDGSGVDGSATFQAVLFEARSDVLFNYKDVFFHSTSTKNYGAKASVGIQSTRRDAAQHSYRQAVLRDEMALLWRTDIPPDVESLTPSRTLHAEGSTVTLATHVADLDGDAPFTAAWDLEHRRGDFDADAITSLAAAGLLQRSLTLPQDGRRRVLLKVTDAGGAYVTRMATLDAYNVAPSLSTLRFKPNGTSVNGASLPYGVAGQPIRFETTLSDPGADAPWLVEWDLDYEGAAFNVDAVQSHATTGTVSISRSYPSGSYTVAVRAVDEGGTSADAAWSPTRTVSFQVVP